LIHTLGKTERFKKISFSLTVRLFVATSKILKSDLISLQQFFEAYFQLLRKPQQSIIQACIKEKIDLIHALGKTERF